MSAARPIVWSIAGSDSGAGAGIQADLRAFDASGVHGCTAIAAITAQNSIAVTRIEAVSPEVLESQLAALADDMPPAAIKTGLLGSADNVRVVARWVDLLRANGHVALVVDPVLRASTGASFADGALVAAIRDELLPRATLVTPNRAEAAALLGEQAPGGADAGERDRRAGAYAGENDRRSSAGAGETGRRTGADPFGDDSSVEQAARALRSLGPLAVAITGGDSVRGANERSRDWVLAPQAQGWLSLPRIDTPHNHGTGCVFAASAAAALARGWVAIDAAILAKMACSDALRHARPGGAGAGPVRPGPGFARDPRNLPALEIPGRAPEAGPRFAPLADPALGIYAIVDSADWVRRVIEAGVRTVQLRIKDPAAPGLAGEIGRASRAARAAGAQFFVNDHWRLAIEHGAYGVHLGQEDLLDADLDAIAAAGLRLGLSSHAYWEVCRARAIAPSYLACGPIHPTVTKDMPWIAQGEDNLAYWCAVFPAPVVAIAGLDPPRAAAARHAGAAGAAVLRGITAAPDPREAVAGYARAWDSAASGPRRAVPEFPSPTLPGEAVAARGAGRPAAA